MRSPGAGAVYFMKAIARRAACACQHRDLLHHVRARRRGGRSRRRSDRQRGRQAQARVHPSTQTWQCSGSAVAEGATQVLVCAAAALHRLVRVLTPLPLTAVLGRVAAGICLRPCPTPAPSAPRASARRYRSDVKKLVADDSTLTDDALANIMRDYNTEHMTAAPLPGTKASGGNAAGARPRFGSGDGTACAWAPLATMRQLRPYAEPWLHAIRARACVRACV